MMTVSEIKAYLKQEKITYKTLSEKCGIPEGTLKQIFSGATRSPRSDTMSAIENALFPQNNKISAISAKMHGISDDGLEEISRYIDYIKNKEKL